MKFTRVVCLAIATVTLAAAQDRDFLTPNEVEQIRQTQDGNERLQLYLHFARQRMDLVEQYLAKEKPGRSIFIHNALEDYNKIIESIDTVADDALRHNRPIDAGMLVVLSSEKEFLDKLNKIQESEPKDFDRYKFVLAEAIDTTTDSHELSMEDSKKRGTELSTKDAKDKSDRESMMSNAEQKERKKATAADEEPKKKLPSLYRPGEKPKDPQQ